MRPAEFVLAARVDAAHLGPDAPNSLSCAPRSSRLTTFSQGNTRTQITIKGQYCRSCPFGTGCCRVGLKKAPGWAWRYDRCQLAKRSTVIFVFTGFSVFFFFFSFCVVHSDQRKKKQKSGERESGIKSLITPKYRHIFLAHLQHTPRIRHKLSFLNLLRLFLIMHHTKPHPSNRLSQTNTNFQIDIPSP